YLVAAVCFILALKGLTSPKSARYGNILGALGMLVAVGMTFVNRPVANVALIVIAIAVGVGIGVPAARLVKMTAMPQMVAAFNGVGGGAAALVDIADFSKHSHGGVATWVQVAVIFGVAVGCVSFSGSIIAFLKLQEVMTGTPITYKGQQAVNGLVGVGILALAGTVLATTSSPILAIMAGLALLFGVAFVLPIGGADMPVVISLLNSFTGLAVAASGFVLGNVLLIVAGTLVGASGTLLTRMMSQAMGRSLANVLFGAFGKVVEMDTSGAAGGEDRPVRSAGADDIGTLLAYSSKVVIVPGYGLAVAQAQHTVKELADALEKRGVEVDYAIHPVAGRMPGHMNVLLAEADVPYEQLKEMDDINPEFSSTDVALVVGANDVVNPAARDMPGSPIYGMPILDVDKAMNVVFLKRSMRPGFAGIDNVLFYDPKVTLMFGDAKESLSKLVAAVKSA
ncbi:MAG TPA: NAD(P)(+) transhydrogenase (Re/Si-specific) subunit beta, partial [Acidimicrobiales bacterium]|nr:NAD(P)(+) transhydrogenase (Re/Si-specific) subunit beta [Acidimicrobiales bacterium]